MYEYLTYFEDIDTNRPEPFSRVDNTALNVLCATVGWRVVNSGMVNSLKRGVQQIQWVHLLEREKRSNTINPKFNIGDIVAVPSIAILDLGVIAAKIEEIVVAEKAILYRVRYRFGHRAAIF